MKVKLGGKKPIAELEQVILNTPQIADRTWLKAKVTELSGRTGAEGWIPKTGHQKLHVT